MSDSKPMKTLYVVLTKDCMLDCPFCFNHYSDKYKKLDKGVIDTKTIIEIHLKHSFEKDLEWTDKIMYEVPNVVGKNVKDAKKLLSNFTVEYSGTGEKVVSQSPDANTKLEDRGTVRLLLE